MVALTIGTRLGQHESAVQLSAERFNRHTFWCGQSGSGKTYALGVVLEQLLLHTELPLLILDPNADFTRFGQVRAGANPEAARAVAAADIRVLNSTNPRGERLRSRFVDLSVTAKAAVLQLDPIADLEEYNALLHAEARIEAFDESGFLSALRGSGEPGMKRLAIRVENLQVLEWDLWSWGGEAVTDIIDTRPRERSGPRGIFPSG